MLGRIMAAGVEEGKAILAENARFVAETKMDGLARAIAKSVKCSKAQAPCHANAVKATALELADTTSATASSEERNARRDLQTSAATRGSSTW